MNIITRLVYDPFLYGECLLEPTKQIITKLSNSERSLNGISQTTQTICMVALCILTAPLALIGCCVKSFSIIFGTDFYTRSLRVKKFQIDSPERIQISSIVKQWKAVAQTKEENCKDPYFKKVFSDSKNTLNLISHRLNKHHRKNIRDTVFVCQDKTLRHAQAIALTNVKDVYKSSGSSLGRYIKVDLIASNPINIRSEVNETEYTRVYGASRAIFARLARRCVKKKLNGLYVESINTACGFYKKLGFKKLKKEKIKTTWDPEKIIPMRLKKKYFDKSLFEQELSKN